MDQHKLIQEGQIAVLAEAEQSQEKSHMLVSCFGHTQLCDGVAQFCFSPFQVKAPCQLPVPFSHKALAPRKCCC